MTPKREVHSIKRVDTFIVHAFQARNLSAFTKAATQACEHAVASQCGPGTIEVHVRWKNRLADGCHACIDVTWSAKNEPEELYLAVTGTRLGEVLEGDGKRFRRGRGRLAAMRASTKNKGYT